MNTYMVRGNLDEVIINERNLYEGNLIKYFQIIFFQANNLNNPYHNFRHMMHVTWLCHNACTYYESKMTKREMRNLLIAAMFHDFDHRGTTIPDIINIGLAIEAVERYLLPEDRPYLGVISNIIKATEYPYKTGAESFDLSSKILRDADLSQALSIVWLQQVIFGLAAEWKKTPLEVLKMQTNFHKNLKFNTTWATEFWPKEEITKKIDEVDKLIQILEQ